MTDWRSSSFVNRISTFSDLSVEGISEISLKSTSASGISPPSATNPTLAPGRQLRDTQRPVRVEDAHTARRDDGRGLKGLYEDVGDLLREQFGIGGSGFDATGKS